MELYLLATLSILLIVVLVILEHFHRLERADLYNRLMARDLQEYKQSDQKAPTKRNFVQENINRAYREQYGPE